VVTSDPEDPRETALAVVFVAILLVVYLAWSW
jgi:hypothetical protein